MEKIQCFGTTLMNQEEWAGKSLAIGAVNAKQPEFIHQQLDQESATDEQERTGIIEEYRNLTVTIERHGEPPSGRRTPPSRRRRFHK